MSLVPVHRTMISHNSNRQTGTINASANLRSRSMIFDREAAEAEIIVSTSALSPLSDLAIVLSATVLIGLRWLSQSWH